MNFWDMTSLVLLYLPSLQSILLRLLYRRDILHHNYSVIKLTDRREPPAIQGSG